MPGRPALWGWYSGVSQSVWTLMELGTALLLSVFGCTLRLFNGYLCTVQCIPNRWHRYWWNLDVRSFYSWCYAWRRSALPSQSIGSYAATPHHFVGTPSQSWGHPRTWQALSPSAPRENTDLFELRLSLLKALHLWIAAANYHKETRPMASTW